MIFNLTFLTFLFFSCGKLVTKIFKFDKFSFLENLVFGFFFVYLKTIIFIFIGIEFKVLFISLIIISTISLIYFTISNWSLCKKKIAINFNKIKILQIILVFLLVLIIFLENIISISEYPLEAGDGLAYWFKKAKFFIYNPGLEYWPSKHYPNFISSLWAITVYIENENLNFSRIILPFILFVNIFLVYNKFILIYKNFIINTLLFLFILIFFSTSTFSGYFRYSNSGYVDFAVATFFMSGFVYIFLSFINNNFNQKDYIFGCFCLGLLSSIKNEGLVISFCLLLILNFIFFINYYHLYKKNFKIIIYSNILFFVIAILPLIFLKYLELVLKIEVDSATSVFFSYGNLIDLENLKARFPIITSHLIQTLITNRTIVMVFLLIIFVNIFLSEIPKIIYQFLFLVVAFSIFYIYAIYFATKLPFEWHLATSIDRIFFPFTGIISGLCFILCNHLKKI